MAIQTDCPVAIPTEYRGVQFKSRLEADVVLLLDRMGFEWQYEPASILLPSGIHYMPDFYLPKPNIWIEARGYESEKGERQLTEFGALQHGRLAVIRGHGKGEWIGDVNATLSIGLCQGCRAWAFTLPVCLERACYCASGFCFFAHGNYVCGGPFIASAVLGAHKGKLWAWQPFTDPEQQSALDFVTGEIRQARFEAEDKYIWLANLGERAK